MFERVFAFAFLSVAVVAQDCPHTTTRFVPTQITVGPVIECSGTRIVIDGVQFGGDQTQGCPTVVVVVPGHLEPQHSPGCGTMVVPDNEVVITRLRFVCKSSYFLFIRLSSECVQQDDRIVGSIRSYKAIPCPNGLLGTLAVDG
ncbi:MAG: hypothetical protein HZB39_18075 [Planctomycetes bacterium]|nr:hypothetical protein [Planctomycetota bacterium]